MPQIPIIMPQLGESIAEATIVSIAVAAGRNGGCRSGSARSRDEQGGHVPGQSLPRQGAKVDCRGEAKLRGRRRPRLPRRHAGGGGPRRPRYPLARASGGRVAAAPTKKPMARPPRQRRARSSPRCAACRCRPMPPARAISPRACARGCTDLGLHAADLAGIAGQRRSGAGHHRGFRKFHRPTRAKQVEPGLDHARGRGRRHAPELDAPAGDCGAPGQH